jgi:glycosyltransferase involved in cell wall biosynthesis
MPIGAHDTVPTTRKLDLTIIVPTRNEAANIGSFLRSIPPEIAVVIVDGSSDETRAIVHGIRPTNTTLLDCPGSLTAARQLGAARAATHWLLFTDADVTFADDYFERLRPLICAEAPTACVRRGARLGLVYGPKLSRGEFATYYRAFAWAQRVVDIARIPAASGSNMLITAPAFAAVGGFDTTLCCNEDSELGWRIARAGHSCRFDPRLIVWASDHRRLRRGRLRKTLHTAARCFLLYLDLVPLRWRSRDWGYWSEPSTKRFLEPSG